MVKIYTGRPDERASILIRDHVLTRCAHCNQTPRICYPRANTILGAFVRNMYGEGTSRFNYSDTSEGACMARVWERVNQLKHEPDEIQQPEDPARRWNDCYIALSGIIQIYRDFLTHLNLLT